MDPAQQPQSVVHTAPSASSSSSFFLSRRLPFGRKPPPLPKKQDTTLQPVDPEDHQDNDAPFSAFHNETQADAAGHAVAVVNRTAPGPGPGPRQPLPLPLPPPIFKTAGTTWSLLHRLTPIQTLLSVTLTLYLLNQCALLPTPLSAIVSQVLFYPTLPITVTKRFLTAHRRRRDQGTWWCWGWMTPMDDTVIMGGAPFAWAGVPQRLYQQGVRTNFVVTLCVCVCIYMCVDRAPCRNKCGTMFRSSRTV